MLYDDRAKGEGEQALGRLTRQQDGLLAAKQQGGNMVTFSCGENKRVSQRG